MTQIVSKLLQFSSVALLLATTLVSQSWAQQHIYPGLMCEPTSPSKADEIQADQFLYRRTNGGILNKSDDRRFVDCPIVRDRDQTSNLRRIVVNVLNSEDGDSITCSAFSYTGEDVVLQLDEVTDSFNRPGAGTLTMRNLRTAPNGASLLRCRLSPRSTLIRYHVSE